MAYTKYSLTPANNNAAPPDGAPEGMLPSAVNDTMRDMMAQIRDVGDGIRGGTYTMTAPVITGGSISGLSSLASTGVATFSAGSVSAPAITTTGDTNTGIFFPAADTIAFTEAGVESMRINSSGQLGIGTTSPTVPLQIYNATNASILMQGDAGANLTIQRYSTNSTQPSLILFKARGTLASPTAVATGDQIGSVVFQAYGGTNTRSIAGIRGYAETYTSDTDISSYLWFGTTPSGTTSISERMRIDSSGNCGIGTSSPGRRLDVSAATGLIGITSSTGTNYAAFQALNTGGTMTLGLEGSSPVIFTGSTAYSAIFGTNGAYSLHLATNNTVRATIDSSGNVGIGRTNPGFKLDIAVSAGGNAFNATDLATSDFRIVPGVSSGIVRVGPSSGGMAFYSSDSERMRIDSSGNLLVGTTSANATLTVNGANTSSANNSFVARKSDSTVVLQVRNDGYVFLPTTYGITTGNSANLFINTDGSLLRSTSSLKYKSDVNNAVHGLAEVLKLRPVTYKGKSETDGNTIFGGLIAEEVHEVGLSEFVQYADDGTPDALAYGNMVSLCVKAIQELNAKVAILESQLQGK
jgi:trimeric autotransporter adhesin